jgi:pimeloyl-ACP methyl ester carboxylesterase
MLKKHAEKLGDRKGRIYLKNRHRNERQSIAIAVATAILAAAPPRFALVGISMGGYICLEIIRQAPERILKLALLRTLNKMNEGAVNPR